jgi:hypothetical protein
MAGSAHRTAVHGAGFVTVDLMPSWFGRRASVVAIVPVVNVAATRSCEPIANILRFRQTFLKLVRKIAEPVQRSVVCSWINPWDSRE